MKGQKYKIRIKHRSNNRIKHVELFNHKTPMVNVYEYHICIFFHSKNASYINQQSVYK